MIINPLSYWSKICSFSGVALHQPASGWQKDHLAAKEEAHRLTQEPAGLTYTLSTAMYVLSLKKYYGCATHLCQYCYFPFISRFTGTYFTAPWIVKCTSHVYALWWEEFSTLVCVGTKFLKSSHSENSVKYFFSGHLIILYIIVKVLYMTVMKYCFITGWCPLKVFLYGESERILRYIEIFEMQYSLDRGLHLLNCLICNIPYRV